jgi:3-oxoacyl-[acyl-carrier-protein] synthase-3
MLFPSTCCLIQKELGLSNAWGYDLVAACSGFVFALQTARAQVETGAVRKALVIGTEIMTSILDFTDRNSCILFGDGAAAVVVERLPEGEVGIVDHIHHIDGAGGQFLYMPGGGSLNPPTHETVDKRMHYIFQDGKAVFKVAVKGMADVSAEIMERNNLKSEDVSWLVPHQANLRIVDATADRMGIDRSKVMINIDKYGNTTAATIPLCLSEWWLAGKLKKGQNIVLSSFGAGYTWGAVLIKWSIENPKG